ncbi:tagaturonate reductase [Paenibacillus rhizovicinus]|uniref:Tagaturonate reductase n=2 Tax=Paenibacillus rhizovicinus TaxID=2704463 RepID=A0A6C0PAB4_9BACL|nr:tagaturonate reductase [Paenibacillus rhizovicinus]
MNGSAANILQIGEGNFLRGFADWMIHTCRKQGLFAGSIAVTQPRPAGQKKIAQLAAQDGLYTLVVRGLENGERVERREVIKAFSQVFDPYAEWGRFLALADNPELELVISNTTEAGLAYRPEPLADETPTLSFPGKVARLLYRRYETFGGAPDKGLIFLPCELIDRNGDTLRECVLRYAADWQLPEAFANWVRAHNRFLNSLVDRIVTGYPDDEQAEAWFAEWGYRDEMLTACEPYHLWAIEAEPELERLLPLRAAGLNVHWVDDLTPFQLRKVRLLNGAHTLMTPLGLLHGLEHVRELMEQPAWSEFVRRTVEEEIIPSLPYPEPDMRAYAEAVYERYLNPFIRHRLYDIAMNSLSKVRARLLPSMAHYAERGVQVPDGLVKGFAGLLRYYRAEERDGKFVGRTLAGSEYELRDDAGLLAVLAAAWSERQPVEKTLSTLLADTALWGRDLSGWPGFTERVLHYWNELERLNA